MALKKEFSFQGKSVEELKRLSIEEFAKLCSSRTKRSLLRGFDKQLLKKMGLHFDNPAFVIFHYYIFI